MAANDVCPLSATPIQNSVPANATRTPSSSASMELVREYMHSRAVYATQGLGVVVDGFRYVKPYKRLLESRVDWETGQFCAGTREDVSDGGAFVLYFLSHFHSDHYTGISQSWAHGTIYCSGATAAMVTDTLGVSSQYVFPMDINTNYMFVVVTTENAGCRVHVSTLVENPLHADLKHYYEEHARKPESMAETTDNISSSSSSFPSVFSFVVRLISSNHCPGAVMFLFYSPHFGYLLHTGDFRFNGKSNKIEAGSRRRGGNSDDCNYETFIEDDAYLQQVAGKIEKLFLDNTFCNPLYIFPTQGAVSQVLVDLVYSRFLEFAVSSQKSSCHIAVLIGSYIIGKERIALELQRAFKPAAKRSSSTETIETGIHITAEGEEEKGEEGTPPDDSERFHSLPILVSPSKLRMLTRMSFFPHHFASWSTETADTVGEEVQSHTTVLEPTCRPPVEVDISRNVSSGRSPEPLFYLSIYLVPMGSVGYVTLRDALGLSALSPRARQPNEAKGDPPATHLELEKGGGVRLNLQSFDHIIAVEPTGFAKKVKKSNLGSRGTRISVPYSEHCSFEEMVDFVRFINPRRIIPTVDVAQYRKHESLFLEKAPRLIAQHGGTIPLNRLFSSIEHAAKRRKTEKNSDDALKVVSSDVEISKQEEQDSDDGEKSKKVKEEKLSPPLNPFKSLRRVRSGGSHDDEAIPLPLVTTPLTTIIKSTSGSNKKENAMQDSPLCDLSLNNSCVKPTSPCVEAEEENDCIVVCVHRPTIVISDDD